MAEGSASRIFAPGPRRSLGLWAALAVTLGALTGCGDGDTTTPTDVAEQRLLPADRALIERSEDAIAAYCRRFALFRLQKVGSLPAELERRAFAGAEDLAALEEAKPRAPLSAAEDLHLHVSDVIENLEAINCDDRLIDLFEQAVSG